MIQYPINVLAGFRIILSLVSLATCCSWNVLGTCPREALFTGYLPCLECSLCRLTPYTLSICFKDSLSNETHSDHFILHCNPSTFLWSSQFSITLRYISFPIVFISSNTWAGIHYWFVHLYIINPYSTV